MKRHQNTAREQRACGTTSPFQAASAILFILSKSSGWQINPCRQINSLTGLIPVHTGKKHSIHLENQQRPNKLAN
jgi:hypothetical protein